jgi:hypothetical protein
VSEGKNSSASLEQKIESAKETLIIAQSTHPTPSILPIFHPHCLNFKNGPNDPILAIFEIFAMPLALPIDPPLPNLPKFQEIQNLPSDPILAILEISLSNPYRLYPIFL